MHGQESERYALIDALAEEFADRYRRGEHPPVQEYVDRYPDLADDIRELLPALAEVEQVKVEFGAAPEAAPEAAPSAVLPSTVLPLEQIGDFRIIREVGRGGMGVVYEAEQVSLARRVALKLLPTKMVLDGKAKQRFAREAKAAGKLHHTNIVPVFGVGEHDGVPYFVMQFIPGLGLDDVLAELKLLQGKIGTPSAALHHRHISPTPRDRAAVDVARSLMTGEYGTCEAATVDIGPSSPPLTQLATGKTDAASLSSSVVLPGQEAGSGRSRSFTYWHSVARIGIQVAEAVDYAHKQGILHRDIKPSNLLLDEHGTVWVTDFGLAKVDDQPNLTDTGDILGTLRYMPPEAFDGRADARGDVYALGLTLYELLAFRPGFDETDRAKLIKQVSTTEPDRLRKVNRHVPRDLETIVHKAIEREPQRRYATAGDFAADLRRFLNDEPIHARRLSSVERLFRWGRRNKVVAALASIAALALLTVAVVAGLDNLRLQKERDAVLDEQRRASRAELKAVVARTDALFTAAPDSVPFILDSLQDHAATVLPDLERRADQWEPQSAEHLRLLVALAVLGKHRLKELCARVEQTPASESHNLLRGLDSCDRDAAVRELERRYKVAKPGEGRTRLSIALLTLGDPRAAQAELALRPDPSDRVRFIHVFRSWHGPLSGIPELLCSIDDSAFRSGLCLAAASSIDDEKTAPAAREALEGVLAELYTTAPDGATHSAATWALRRLRGFEAQPELPATQGPVDGRQWFVNRLGMTMIGIQPGSFQTWSYDPAMMATGQSTLVVLTRPFFMLDQEVTADWYRRFLASDDHPPGEELTPAARNADLRFSLAQPDWRSALLFCNWLSRREGRKPCYRLAGISDRTNIVCDFQANGYRLATDAEWEYVFRCGTTTRYLTGGDVSRLLDYGRVLADDPGPGKQFLPSPWGLFDQVGNGWEICWDLPEDYRGATAIDPVGAHGKRYAMRGGTAEGGLHYLHGSARFPASVNDRHCFRVVCGPLGQGPPPNPRAAALAALQQWSGELPLEALRLRARLLADRGDWPAALADLKRGLERSPADRLLALHAAASYIEAGDIDGYRRFRRALLAQDKPSQDPFDPERTVKACLLLPATLEETRRCAALAGQALRIGAANPHRAYFALAAALAAYRLGDDQTALQQLASANRSEWNWAVPAQLLRAMAMYRQGEHAAARVTLAHACRTMDDALPSLSDAQDAWHDVPICRILRREAVALLSRPAPTPSVAMRNTLALYSLSQALLPYHPRPYYERGLASLRSGDAQQAILAFNTALVWQPDDGKFRGLVHVQRARAHAALKEYDQAVADYEAALKNDPKRPYACNELARLYVLGPPSLRDTGKALALAERAVALLPNRPDFRSTLGIVYYRLGRYTDALQALERSLTTLGDQTAVDRFFLTLTHDRLGHDQQSGAEYARAVRWADELGATLPPPARDELRTARAEADAALATGLLIFR